MHPQTVCCVLKSAGLKAMKKIKKPKLTTCARKECIAFALAHQHWTIEDWKHVLWSDETKINHLGSAGVKWGWVHGGKELFERLIVETGNFGGGSLMFWGCMGYCPNLDKGTQRGWYLQPYKVSNLY
jgi:hypothetical protein